MDNRKLRFAGTTQITNQGHEENVYELCDENDMTVAYVTDPDADKELVKRWNAHPELIEALNVAIEKMTQYIPKAAKGYENGCFKYIMGGADIWNCQCPICQARTVIAKTEQK